jgi:hypothetical protein
MNKIYLVLLCGLLFSAKLNAETQSWNIGTPVATNVVATFNPADSTFTVTGTGQMTNYWVASSRPWHDVRNSIKTVIINTGITNIGANAFSGFTALASVHIPEGVVNIGEAAFNGCQTLTSVTIPNSVTSISNSVFQGCASLTSVTIGTGVISFGQNAFLGCTALTSVTVLRAAPPVVQDNTFQGVNLQNVCLYVIPESVELYGAAEFWKGFECIEAIFPEDNCDLASLSVSLSRGTFAFAFNASVTACTYTVLNSDNQLTIAAVPADRAGATVSGA